MLKKLYMSNSIIQFAVSYSLVFILPLLLLVIGFNLAFEVVEDKINQSNMNMLTHSESLIEGQLKTIKTLAYQGTQNDSLRQLVRRDEIDGSYFLLAKDSINKFDNPKNYEAASLIKEVYIYLPQSQFVIYENALYRLEIFKKYIHNWGMDFEEWEENCSGTEYTGPQYVSLNNHLLYIMPFSSGLLGNRSGAIIYNLDSEELGKLLNFGKEYEEFASYILDEEGTVLWKKEEMKNPPDIRTLSMAEHTGYLNTEGQSIFYTSSDHLGWKYVLVMPKRLVFSQLTALKRSILIYMLLAISTGLLLAGINAIRKGTFINELCNIFGHDTGGPKTSKKLGELAAQAVHNNEALLEELEGDKPLLKKAFLHDLIKGEFVSSTELNYCAQKAGIKADGQAYGSAAFRLFCNNDFYDTDEQTMEEVRILSQLIMNHLTSTYTEEIWFYKRDYLTTLAVFSYGENEELIRKVVEETYEWVLKEYKMESHWGIGNKCEHMLEVWKICEEAAVALVCCKGNKPVVKYEPDLVNEHEFYFPQILEERMTRCLQSGEVKALEYLLTLLEEENAENRQISRKMLLKLNTRLSQMVAEVAATAADIKDTEVTEWIYELNEQVIQFNGSLKPYFVHLKKIVMSLCKEMNQKKTVHRKQLVEEVIAFIHENYHSPELGLAKVAAVFNISEGYVSSIFKAQTSINFADYIENLRIEKACKLLIEGKMAVSEVSEKVGYNSVYSFRRAFKRVKNMNPKDYRNWQEEAQEVQSESKLPVENR